jgi:uncharacterized protein (DUF433 family)
MKWSGLPRASSAPARIRNSNSPQARLRRSPTTRAAVREWLCYVNDQGVRHMQSVIVKDVDILGGEPVFRGTRVPFKILIEYLEGGDTLDQFLDQYPTVSRELAVAALQEARSSLVSHLK